MRTVWTQSKHVHLFYVLIMNRFGKHCLTGLRLWLGLEYHQERHSTGFHPQSGAYHRNTEGYLLRCQSV